MPSIHRRSDLLVQTAGEEVILYDPRTHHLHRLPPPAARIWDAIDWQREEADLITMARNQGIALPELVVAQVLTELAAAGLLTGPPERIDRKGMLARAGLLAGAGLLLPLVGSLAAPTLAHADYLP